MLRALAANWELKLVALGIALVVWFFVVSADQREVVLSVPLEYVGLERGLVMVAAAGETVEVQARAARWAARRLGPSTVRVRADLARLGEGDHLVVLAPAQVEAPAGVVVSRVSPGFVRVSLAEAASRAVAVVPQIRGTPAPAHRLGRVQVTPPTVQVTGPRTTIEGRPAVETVPVDIDGSRQSVTRTVGLVLPEAVHPVDTNTVQVTVEIRPEEPMRQDRPTGGAR